DRGSRGDPGGRPLPVLARCLDHVQMPLLILAVDMPMASVALLQTLLENYRSGCGTIFCGENGYEPLCALYPMEILPLARESLASGNLRMQTFAQRAVDAGCLRAIPLAKDLEELFFNLNTPADLSWMPPPLSL
ncbi:MAG: molybdenum cofactor guanylyltransferase, partial [Roseimicrobium sp.]